MGRRTIVLVIAIVLAVVAAFAVWQYLTTVEDDIRSDISEVRVYRATELIASKTPGEEARPFIEEGKALRESIVFEGSTILCIGPEEGNEGKDPNEFGCPENPSDLNTILENRVAAGPISAGQLVTTEQWVELQEFQEASLSESIVSGKVAIGIQPSDVKAAGGFVRPGDRVNLLASATIEITDALTLYQYPELAALLAESQQDTTEAPPTGEGVVTTTTSTAPAGPVIPTSIDFTQTILQDLEVLAVGADTRPSRVPSGLTPVGTQIIVLEVTPAQAEQIEFAQQYTSIALTLLPQGPYTPFESSGVVVDDIFTLLDRIQAELEAALGGAGN
jgi:Flp pilus assembly protein CpaB